jgi:hypothetical protein
MKNKNFMIPPSDKDMPRRPENKNSELRVDAK